MSKVIDLTGQTFGRLKVLGFHHKEQKYSKDGKPRGHRYFWLCECTCKNRVVVSGSNLKGKNSTSCGCLTHENASKVNTKHGHSNERLYHVWQGMKDRCYNKNHVYYKNYGGRGISVCKDWLDYGNFREFMIQQGYKEDIPRGECSLERIDVNGNYEPSNCKIIAMKQQCYNRRDTLWVEFKGEKKTLVEWASLYGVDRKIVYTRIKRGWGIEDALTKPIKRRAKA